MNLLEKGTPILFNKHSLYLDYAKAMKGTSLFKIVLESGNLVCETIVTKMLNELKSVSKTYYTGANINTFVKMIIARNQELKISELILCINNGINGMYKKEGTATVYGEITYDVIAEWIERFKIDKEEFLYREHINKKNGRGFLDDYAMIAKAKKWDLPKIKIGEEPPPPNMKKEKGAAEIRVQNWMKHFDKLFELFPLLIHGSNDKPSIRMIRRYGKILTLDNYLKHKLKQWQSLKGVD